MRTKPWPCLLVFMGMGFLIKYIRDGQFVGTDRCEQTLAETYFLAQTGLRTHGADIAAVMDEDDQSAAPLALFNLEGKMEV